MRACMCVRVLGGWGRGLHEAARSQFWDWRAHVTHSLCGRVCMQSQREGPEQSRGATPQWRSDGRCRRGAIEDQQVAHTRKESTQSRGPPHQSMRERCTMLCVLPLSFTQPTRLTPSPRALRATGHGAVGGSSTQRGHR